MSIWDELRAFVDELRDDPRRPIRGFVDVASERSPSPRCQLTLAAWATEIASEVHARFGGAVAVTLGALPFPYASSPAGGVVVHRPPRHLLRLRIDEVAVSLRDELEVRSGFDAISELQLRNLGRRELTVRTNGNLTARVLDPVSGEVVGGFVGAQPTPHVVFRLVAGETTSVPLLLGTTSFVRTLGYAIPAGQWAFDAVLDLGDSGRYVTSQLPFTVVP
ncbi:MAG TPA: hypothetical protein VIJ34_07820 [Acidimicrobiales bacterium]